MIDLLSYQASLREVQQLMTNGPSLAPLAVAISVGDDWTAFAVGATAVYSSNVECSETLHSIVGGPRRAHTYRDRLGSRVLGATTIGNATTNKSLKVLRKLITFGAANAALAQAHHQVGEVRLYQ